MHRSEQAELRLSSGAPHDLCYISKISPLGMSEPEEVGRESNYIPVAIRRTNTDWPAYGQRQATGRVVSLGGFDGGIDGLRLFINFMRIG